MTEQTVNQEDELADDGVWTTTPEGERIPNYEATFPDITEGQVVTGTVGTNTVKGKALAPGTYEVLLTAVDAAGNKTTKTLTAKLVVKRAKKKR